MDSRIEKHREANRRYYATHKEQEHERNRQWYEKNREKSKEKSYRWRQAHPERYREIARFHSNKRLAEGKVNKEAHRASCSRWRKANPEKHCQQQANRRAKIRGAEGSHTLEQWNKLMEHYNFSCYYCSRTNLPLTRDHIIPISRGGKNYIWNIVPSCRPCNSKKGVRNGI